MHKQIHIFKSTGKIISEQKLLLCYSETGLFLWQESSIERNNNTWKLIMRQQ